MGDVSFAILLYLEDGVKFRKGILKSLDPEASSG